MLATYVTLMSEDRIDTWSQPYLLPRRMTCPLKTVPVERKDAEDRPQ